MADRPLVRVSPTAVRRARPGETTPESSKPADVRSARRPSFKELWRNLIGEPSGGAHGGSANWRGAH